MHPGHFLAPHFAPLSRSRPKFREHCRPLTCACVPTLVRIGGGLPDLFRKVSKNSNTIIGFQPTNMVYLAELIVVITDGLKVVRICARNMSCVHGHKRLDDDASHSRKATVLLLTEFFKSLLLRLWQQ